MSDLPEIREGLVIYPGDHLLVTVPFGTSAEFVQQLKDRFAERHSDIDVTVLTAQQIAVVRRSP